MDDSGIIGLFDSRDENAIRETEKKYGAYFRCIAENILKNASDASECVNDTYLKLWETIPPEKPESLSAYGGRLTRNNAFDRLRKRRSDKRIGGETAAVLDELAECVPENGSENITDNLVIRDAIQRFLGSQSPEHRKMFVRRYWYYASVGEIAKEAGMNAGSVRNVLMKQRRELKQMLEEEGISL